MTNLEIVKLCEDKEISELGDLIALLKDLKLDKYNKTYKEVRIHPGTRIEDKIMKETGFICRHEKADNYSAGRGTHIILIPIEQYTNELKQELIDKYDDKW